ncbi:thioesterase II family protein [Saccharothrix yanglingensis]|uniref:Thioesterase n=1 Tax=Saccharothrix yanglingensis TaxID=659496 RepID=A0ABU0X9X3_9PSEU|nr:alpha/beta fold hydrolase [Saccharothrix yanglingensis]MDQ2588937.1 thioesterase [Saccharothrix yanglingensis]
MSAQRHDERARWLREYHASRRAAPRLVCFPHAGGSASWYHPMSHALAPDVSVLAVQYPGRQDRRGEVPLDDVGAIARQVAPLVADLPGGPPALFGHSMGALVAFEVARLMTGKHDEAPAHLYVSGRRAPDRHRSEAVHLMDERGLLAEVAALGGTGAANLRDRDLVAMVLPPLRADYRAVETYRHTPGEPLTCPVTVLTGDADPKTTAAEAEGWREHTTGAFDLRVYPGGHFFLTDHQAEVLDLLRGGLTRARRSVHAD